jgi:hypothetical protein
LPIQPIGKTTEIRILEPFDFVVASHQGGNGEISDEGSPVDLPELPLGLEAVAHARNLSEVRQDVTAEHDPVRAHVVD